VKLRALVARAGMVPRAALVDRLIRQDDRPVAVGRVPLLQTHLTFREIGDRLYVSRHTVKTQAISVYRKLGVSSRSELITGMRELGLLAHA
jgi:Bacterial regulatory proteins, luxR family